MKISSITDAEKYLALFIPNAKKYVKDGLSLRRMWPLLKAADNPHEKLKAIHVAGTSGKTSTAYYIGALLSGSGQKTAVTVSPHMKLNDRLQIDGIPMEESKFCQYLEEFSQLVDESEQPSYFELLMVFILWACVREKIDYVVLETGLGGLLDSTNVVTRTDKVCVLTDIGYDHMDMLGDTLTDIASQKAGIIHACNHAFTFEQGDEVMAAFSSRAEHVGANLHIVKSNAASTLHVPLYQQRNFALALATCQYVAERDRFEIAEIDPSSVYIPARMEVRTHESGDTILDGAHNEQKMLAFIDSFKAVYPHQKAHFLLALKQGKEAQKVFEIIAPIARSLILTTFSVGQDVPFHSHDPYDLCRIAQKGGVADVVVIQDPHEAVAKLQEKRDLKIITGSLYLIADVRGDVS